MGCVEMSQSVSADESAAVIGQTAPDFTATGIDEMEFNFPRKLKLGDRDIMLVFGPAS
jgi:hypothetical protein